MPVANLFVTAQTRQAVGELEKLRMASATTWGSIGKMAELAAIGVAAAAGSIWIATAAVQDWHKSMVNAAAIGGLTEAQMWKLADASVEAGRAVGIASSEIAEGYLELTRAGFSDMNEIMEMNNVIMKAAISNQIDYATAAEVTIKSLNAFGIGVEDAEEKVAVLQYIANQTLAEFDTFADVMRYAGSTSAFAGIRFEELASMMGVLTDVAMEAGIGARGINQMLLDMVKSAGEFSAFAQRMGVDVEVFTEEGTLNLSEIISKFGELGLTMNMLEESAGEFNVRALRAWLGLIGNASRYQELLEGTADSADYFNRTYMAQLENIDVILGMIREEFLGIFRNKETVEMLKDFFWTLRSWVRDGIAERIGEFMRVLMTGMITNAPMVMSLLNTVMETLVEIGPAMMGIASIVTSMADGGMLKLYIVMKLMSPIWDMLVTNLQYMKIALQTIPKDMEASTLAMHNQSMAAQGLTNAIGSLVTGYMGLTFAMMMYSDAASASGKNVAILMGLMSALNIVMSIAVPLAIAWREAQWGGAKAALAGVAIAAVVVGAAYATARARRREQEAALSAQRKKSLEEYAAWQEGMGIPTAHTGEWEVPGPRDSLRRVAPGEMILKPEVADWVRKGGLGAGGGLTINVNVQKGAYIGDDVVKMIENTGERMYRRQMRGLTR